MSAYVAAPRPVTVVVAGALGIGLAVASVVLPYAAYLRRPDLIALVAGLAVIGSGLVLLRARALGPAGWLVLGAGYAWFLPALAVSDHTGLDRALGSTAFLHIALLVHAVVVVGARTARGGAEWVAVSLGYLAALTAVVGYGYRLALPAAGSPSRSPCCTAITGDARSVDGGWRPGSCSASGWSATPCCASWSPRPAVRRRGSPSTTPSSSPWRPCSSPWPAPDGPRSTSSTYAPTAWPSSPPPWLPSSAHLTCGSP